MKIGDLSPPPGSRAPRPVPGRPAPPPADRVELSGDDPAPSRGRKLLAVGFAGLAAAGAVAGLAGYALLEAPVCTDGGSLICVSPERGHEAQTAYRLFRRQFYEDDARADLASDSNRVFPAPPGSHAAGDGEGPLQVVSWNLHRGQGLESEGSRDQTDLMVERLREEAPDVALLQEVPPWRVAEIVAGTGMDGYYTNTAPGQGNLILVHPDLEVEGNFRETLTFEIEDAEDAARVVQAWKDEGPSQHPRSAQALRLRLEDGSTTVVWNTHLTNVDYLPGQGRQETQRLLDFVDAIAAPGEPVIGGGDLNAEADHAELQMLREHGYDARGARIDWLATRGADLEDVGHETVRDGAWHVSDHPVVRGQVD